MSYYRPEDAKVGMHKEDGFRYGGSTTDILGKALSGAQAFGISDIESFPSIPTPYKNRTQVWTVGNSRTGPSKIAHQGFPATDGTLEMKLQSGRWFYYAMGLATHGAPTTTSQFVITATDSLPSFCLHTEQELSGENIRLDHTGCVVTELNMNFEKEAIGSMSVAFKVAKSLAGADLVLTNALTSEYFYWTDVSTCTLANGTTTYSINDFDKVNFKVTNDLNIIHTLGDEYPRKLVDGKRDYEIGVHCYPEKDDLYAASQVASTAQTWTLDLYVERGGVATDYIRVQMDDMYVATYPNSIPSHDDKILGLDVTFKPKPGNTTTVTVYDTAYTTTNMFTGSD